MKAPVASPLRFATGDGRTIYALSVQAFPGFWGNVYLLDDGQHLTLVDTGSGFESSNESLLAGLDQIERTFGARLRLEDLTCVLITHAHMDHFGGLELVRSRTAAPVGIHPLDRAVLSHYEERVVMASKQLRVFLHRAGVSEDMAAKVMQMYLAPKSRYRSMPASFSLEEGKPVAFVDDAGATIDLGLEVLHTPGHCPGQVCLLAGEVLLCADHVLARTTPHQAPESITLNMGLQHYLDSLARARRFAVERGVRLALGGHEDPIESFSERVDQIRAAHDRRLEQVLELCREPRAIVEVSRGLFDRVRGYNVLLALEETGAHVEYLYHLGELVAANLDEIEKQHDPVVRYVRP